VLPTSKGVRLLGVTVSNFDRASADANDELPLFGAGGATLPPRPHAWPRARQAVIEDRDGDVAK